MIEEHPIALQLRYLQTLLEIGGASSSTIIFPPPIDLIRPFVEHTNRTSGNGEDGGPPARTTQPRTPTQPS